MSSLLFQNYIELMKFNEIWPLKLGLDLFNSSLHATDLKVIAYAFFFSIRVNLNRVPLTRKRLLLQLFNRSLMPFDS